VHDADDVHADNPTPLSRGRDGKLRELWK